MCTGMSWWRANRDKSLEPWASILESLGTPGEFNRMLQEHIQGIL